MKHTLIVGLVGLVALLAANPGGDPGAVLVDAAEAPSSTVRVELSPPRFEHAAYSLARTRLDSDLAAMETFRPSYPFWRHIFSIPDGAVAFGSAVDGRLLAVFPSRGEARWEDIQLASLFDGPVRQAPRHQWRERLVSRLEPHVGPVLHNSTRGTFVLPNARRYGSFLDEWGTIYEHFGVPAEVGLAQVIIESGLSPKIRSEARALGFCQWLESNWNRMKRFSPHVIEGYNQTTQAAYCAAYLTILATKYGSFIPALSEHHTGAVNVGRTLINGERLGGVNIREQYFTGSAFAVDLRKISLRGYRDVFRSYGPRSSLYAEMVFGNTLNVGALEADSQQQRIYASRASRSISLEEVTRKTGLSVNEVRRFNPALIRRVPANANLYLPTRVEEFGPDVTFWHRPPAAAFAALLDEFVRIDVSFEQWDDDAFRPVLESFQTRFLETGSEEGIVMAAVLDYVIDESYRSRRGKILEEFRASPQIQRLFERGVDAVRKARAEDAVAN